MNLRLKQFIDSFIGNALLLVLFIPVRITGLILQRKHDLKSVTDITFLKLLGGGSLFNLYPCLCEIKNNNPEVKLNCICSPTISRFAHTLDIFENIYIINDKNFITLVLSSSVTLVKVLFNKTALFDLEIHSKLSTVFVTLTMAKIRAGLVDSYSIWRKRLYTHALYVNPSTSLYEAYDGIARLFGCQTINIKSAQDKFKILISKSSNIDIPTKTYISVGVGCSDLAFERRLPNSLWKTNLERINQFFENYCFVFLGGNADYDLANQICSSLSGIDTLNYCGKLSFTESLGIANNSQIFIGIDSALMHFSRFLQVPVIGFWGPTHPSSILRNLLTTELHLYNSISCSPCVHVLPKPICNGNNLCMHHLIQNESLCHFLNNLNKKEFYEISTVEKFIHCFYPNQKLVSLNYKVILK